MLLGITILSLVISACHGTVTVNDMTNVYSSSSSDQTGNFIYNYDLRIYADNSSITQYVNTTSYVTKPVADKGGVVMEITSWQDNTTGTPTVYNSLPLVQITKTWQVEDTTASPDTIRVSLSVENLSTVVAENFTFTENLSGGLFTSYSTMTVTSQSEINKVSGEVQFEWMVPSLSQSQTDSLEFIATPSGSQGQNLPDGFSVFQSSLRIQSSSAGVTLGPITFDMCVDRSASVTTSVFYQHGFTALSFFMAFILGIALVIVIVCLFLMFKRRRAVQTKGFAESNLRISQRRKTILMDEGDLMKTGHTVTDYSNVNDDDSFVEVLVIKDKLRRFREIDSLDIITTVKIDSDIEKQRNDASEKATQMLVQGLVHNKDVSNSVVDAVEKNARQRRLALDNNLDDEYKRNVKKLRKKLAAKNKAKMSLTLQRQRDEKKKLASKIADLGDKERQQLMDMMDKQHQSELDENEFCLKLEQDEESENLRKEFAVKKRMAMKEIQQNMLEELSEQGMLGPDKVAWLMEEHRKVQSNLEKMYDEEIARQRLVLEEKLEKRKALAKIEEQQEDDASDLLNTMAGQQIELINKGKSKKGDGMTADEAAELIENAKADMVALKDRLDKEREKQEAALAKKLGDMKRKRLNNMKSEQKSEMDRVLHSMETQTDGPIDPLLYAETKVKLESKHREEMNQVENEVDEEHAEQLRDLNDQMTEKAKDQLEVAEKELLKKIDALSNISSDKYEQILSQHEEEIRRLQAQQRKSQERQMENLKLKLAKSREEWNQRKEQEKIEQEQLREREDEVVKKLISGQMSMSEEERERILQEHEKQMVKLENSLTLNKLRQKRMLEEKLAQKRALQMEKLQQKQTTEYDKKMRQIEHNAEESDPENQREKLALIKNQFNQKMAVLQGQKLDIDDELENVKVEMLKERALALRNQEEQLGAMVAALQVAKARELAKIEEQQAAINNLKSNLMDDLNERGILSDPKCQEIIERHRQDQENLNKRMETQRAKQEKELRKRLKQRIEKKEELMEVAHKREIQELLSKSKNKTAMKIKQMLLIHKHMVAMEKFRNQLDREIVQMMEDVRRQFELKKAQEVQKQELQFIAGLVRVGAFEKNDLIDVLHVLFPGKTDPEVNAILSQIYDPTFKAELDPNVSRNSSLKERVKDSQSLDTARQASLTARLQKKISSKKSSKMNYSNKGDDYEYTYLDARPEPIGEVVEAQHMNDFDTYDRAPPSKLPPLETKTQKKGGKGRKKKKKVLQKVAVDEDDEEGF